MLFHNDMRTFPLLALFFVLLGGNLYAIELPAVAIPKSSPGRAVVTVEKNKLGALPDWLAGIFLNKEEVYVVGIMEKLPFANMSYDMMAYNAGGVLLWQTVGASVSKRDVPYWMSTCGIKNLPISDILKNTSVSIADDFTSISWIEISYLEQSGQRSRTISPPIRR